MSYQRGRLLVAALGFAGFRMLSYDRALWALEERRVEMMLAGFVILICGLAALAYLVMRRMKVDEERDKHERRIMRDIPPPPGSFGV